MKRPSFQFYPADWRKDPALSTCSLSARGLWIELMCVAHESDDYGVLSINGKPMTVQQIARTVGESPSIVTKILEELELSGVFSRNEQGCIFSRRMIKDERIRNVRADSGRLGGNPNLLNQKVNQKLKQSSKQTPTPSSSSSSSTEITERGNNSESVTPIEVQQTAPPVNSNSETKLTPGIVCKQLMALKVSSVNPGHVMLATLIDAGATMDEFTGAAEDAVSKGKGKFAYVLSVVKGQREDAKIASEQVARGELKTTDVAKPAIASKKCEICEKPANANTSMGWRCAGHLSAKKAMVAA